MNSFKTALEVAQITERQERSMKFIVVLHTDDGQRYGVTVPDLPGCFSAGGVWAVVDVPVGQSRSGFLVEAARTAMHAR
jgi:hypothetical protein